MHDLLRRVLDERDLSKAGELFGVSDREIVEDLQTALSKVKQLVASPAYAADQNSQSVAEICLARITSAIRETKTIETWAAGLVELLESALSPNTLEPDQQIGKPDSPHAKIASDILSSLFLHYGKQNVMKLAVPVAVKAVERSSRELQRNTSSYLSLAAIHNPQLLAYYAVPIINSIIHGNYGLIRILPQIYDKNPEPFNAELASLIGVLDFCDVPEKLALLQLCTAAANTNTQLVRAQLSSLRACLLSPHTCSAMLQLYLVFVEAGDAAALYPDLHMIKKAGDKKSPPDLAIIARIVAAIGKLNKSNGQEAVSYLVLQCYKVAPSTMVTLMKEVEGIAATMPDVVQPFLPEIQKLLESGTPNTASKTLWLRIKKLCNNENKSETISIEPTEKKVTVISIDQDSTQHSNGKKLNTKSPDSGVKTDLTPPAARALPAEGMCKFVVTGKLNKEMKHDEKDEKNEAQPSPAAMRSNLSRPKSKSYCNLSTSRHQLTGTPNGIPLYGKRQGNSPLFPGPNQFVPLKINNPTRNDPYSENTHLQVPESHNPKPTTTTRAITGSPAKIQKKIASHQYNHASQSSLLTNRNSMFMLSPSGEYQVQYMNTKGRIRVSHQKLTASHSTTPELMSYSKLVNFEPNINSTGSHVVTTFYPNQSITQRTGSGSMLTLQDHISFNSKGTDYALPNHATMFMVNEPNGVPLPRKKDAQTQSTATLESNGSLHQNYRSMIPVADAVKQFCEKHKQKIDAFIADFSTRFPVPCKCTVEESGHKTRMTVRVHFGCQEKSGHCLYSESLFVFKTKLPGTWLHLMFLHMQFSAYLMGGTHLLHVPLQSFNSRVALMTMYHIAGLLQTLSKVAVGQNCLMVREMRKCWEYLPVTTTKGRSFSALVTSMFPGPKDQQELLKEIQAARYFDTFGYNGENRKWSCFACNHPDKVQNFLKYPSDNPVMEGRLKEKRGRWKFFKRWQTKYFTLSGNALSCREELMIDHEASEDKPTIDLKSVRSVKSVSRRKGRKNLPKAFEIFTDDDNSYVLKAKDRQNAEEWFQCLQIAVAQAQKESDHQVSQL